MNKKALVIGATGATGTALVAQLLDNEKYGEVHIFVRRKVELKNPKLQVHVVDFDAIDAGRKSSKETSYMQPWEQPLKLLEAKRRNTKSITPINLRWPKPQLKIRCLPSYSSAPLDPAVSRHFSTLKSKDNWKMPSAN